MRNVGLAGLLVLAGCATPAALPGEGGVPVPVGVDASLPVAITPLTMSATEWVRAYWRNDTEIPLVEESFSVQDMDTIGLGVGLSNFAFLRPGAGLLVPPGAREVEVTATWTQAADSDALFFIYSTGGTKRGEEPACVAGERGCLENGKPFVIPLAPEDLDAPFQRQSHWWFALDPPEPTVAIEGEIRIVVRRDPATPLPEIPAPIDPWATSSEILLLPPETHEFSGWHYTRVAGDGMTDGCIGGVGGGCDNAWFPPDRQIVAPNATELIVRAQWDWMDSLRPSFGYSINGDERGVPPVEDSETSRMWRVPLEEAMWDSPYQTRSAWTLFVYKDDADPSGDGAHYARGSVTLEARVLRSA